MARCTSPEPRGAPSRAWTAVASTIIAAASLWRRRRSAAPRRRRQLGQIAATLYLAGLGTVSLTAWHAPGGRLSATAGLGGGLHLLLLLSLGGVLALTSLAGRDQEQPRAAGVPQAEPGEGLGELMAHMSHALRTPLNAVIGFSEVMACELHGPLGNSRYQEYAHHICESGGRLLKSSEDALAITQALTSLMTDRRRGRRERVAVGALLREALAAIEGAPAVAPAGCDALTISCERRATAQALEHLCRQALAGSEALEIMAWPDGACGLEIRGSGARARRDSRDPDTSGQDGGELHLIMARLLLKTQGATLTWSGGERGWSARVGFTP